MKTKQFPWRVGRTMGGALGIWSSGCHSDEPDVCRVASVPTENDEARAELIVRAVNSEPVLKAIEARNLFEGLQVGVDQINHVRRTAFEECAKIAYNLRHSEPWVPARAISALILERIGEIEAIEKLEEEAGA